MSQADTQSEVRREPGRSSPRPAVQRLEVRRLDFEFDPEAVPRAWYAGNVQLSAFITGLSLLFPKGEQFFVNSVRHYRSRISDPELQQQVQAFIGQEAMHGKEHRAFNRLVEAQGAGIAPKLEAEVALLLNGARRRLPPIVQLAVTCGLEHFTAILAEQLLGDERHHGAVHPSVRPLWLWHAVEESEHKSVAFDVYQAVGGNYPVRVGTMAVTSVVFVAVATEVHIRLLWCSGDLLAPRQWLKTFGFFWLKPGLFRKLVLPYLDYYRPGFHPSDRDTEQLLKAWVERLFGAHGELKQQLKTQIEPAHA